MIYVYFLIENIFLIFITYFITRKIIYKRRLQKDMYVMNEVKKATKVLEDVYYIMDGQ